MEFSTLKLVGSFRHAVGKVIGIEPKIRLYKGQLNLHSHNEGMVN